MSNLRKFVAVIMIASTSVATANVTLNFANAHAARDYSRSGDPLTLDFSIDGSGGVSMVATPHPASTDPEYVTAVNSWNGLVGTVGDAALFGESFQITIFVTTVDRVTGSIGTERISLDGSYGDGIMGVGGGNASRIDWTSGPQEFLHFAQTGGGVVINLLECEYHGASTATDLWDTQLIAGSVNNSWYNLPGTSGFVDVSALGYVIGSGANELTLSEPLDGTHGLGLAGMTLVIAVPEPATSGLLGSGAISILLIRRFKSHA
jgi:hypothetical protein